MTTALQFLPAALAAVFLFGTMLLPSHGPAKRTCHVVDQYGELS